LVQPATENVDAYTLYLRGRHAWALASLEGFQTAASCFEQTVAADPTYALAHAWLAYAYAMMGFDEFGLMAPLTVMPKARAAATRAIELDDSLGDVHFARALVAALYEWDWALAQTEFERAVEVGSASSLAQHWYAIFLCAMGRADEGLQVIRRAQILDPLSLAIQVTVGRCLHFGRRFDEAAACLRGHLERNPSSIQGYISLARTLVAQQLWADAASELERGIQQVGRVPILLSYSGVAHARLGRPDQARALLAELRQLATQRYVPIIYQAQIAFSLGDLDAGFQLFEQAEAERSGWLVFLRSEPGWDYLRGEGRFQAVVHRLHLDF
jgi:serine/threonine-protein kinase